MMKLISVNIKWDLFSERILELVHTERPDVLCLQEVLDRDIPSIEATMGGTVSFVPMGKVAGVHTRAGVDALMGVGLISRTPMQNITSVHYARYHDGTTIADDEQDIPYNRVLLAGDVMMNGVLYRFATTHFTWTPNGAPDERQERDLARFIPLLDQLGDFVLCGDLNAPRGMATFETLAARYTDNIPRHHTTSLDPELHRLKGSKELMIDGLFSTKEYICSDVSLRFGVSDHAAIIASVERAPA